MTAVVLSGRPRFAMLFGCGSLSASLPVAAYYQHLADHGFLTLR